MEDSPIIQHLNMFSNTLTLTPVNSHRSNRCMPTYHALDESDEEEYPEREVKVYGDVIEFVKPDIEHTMRYVPYTIQLFKGFTGKCDKQRIAGRVVCNRQPTIPRDRVFTIHLFVDVSGSMGCSLYNSQKSRSQIIQDAMNLFRDQCKSLVEKGLGLRLSLHTFSNTCEEKVKTSDVTPEFLKEMDWRDYLEPTNMTNIWDCVRAAKELREQESEEEVENSVYILMSDGEDTCGAPPMREKVFDYAIGIGSSDEYDASILSEISRNDIESCPTETALSSAIIRLGCGSFMKMADAFTINIGGTRQVIDDWMFGSSVLFTVELDNTATTLPISITEVREGGATSTGDDIDITHFSHRTNRMSRKVVNLCVLQEDSKKLIEKDGMGHKEIDQMCFRAEILRNTFKEESWCWNVADGIYQMWETMHKTQRMSIFDRQCSMQSAVRQMTSNNYDVQTAQQFTNYSQSAF